ncbi:WXG100 family type VII secretion target [Nocardia brasiliensis]|uniref:WXG100 family type VII secretion target n=1 Tax=Nocardia brasiliensis TaxID=37326 RepID=UPI0018931F5E|nr:WXG100 family type VII secretion target [Nocardia brasiliensis]MBF6126591.1 WXG100 family type VII secretion target [Nocardia brasiliensis]
MNETTTNETGASNNALPDGIAVDTDVLTGAAAAAPTCLAVDSGALATSAMLIRQTAAEMGSTLGRHTAQLAPVLDKGWQGPTAQLFSEKLTQATTMASTAIARLGALAELLAGHAADYATADSELAELFLGVSTTSASERSEG